MSKSRHLDEEILVRTFGVTFGRSELVPPASETWDQVVYASKGVLTVRTDDGTWVVPPHRAVWVPAGMRCALETTGPTALRMLYLNVAHDDGTPLPFPAGRCAVLNVGPLLRELILRTIRIGVLCADDPHHRRLGGLIRDELRTVDTAPLRLPLPVHDLARRFAEGLDLGPDLDLDAEARRCGSSRRTMERLFRMETGMSLGQWVRRRKLLDGLRRLAAGETTAQVAFDLGYAGPSAFIAMFKRELGEPPGAYLGRTDPV